MQVVRRIIGSMYPNPQRNYLQTHIRPHPDLYGMSAFVNTDVSDVFVCFLCRGSVVNFMLLYDGR